MKDLLVVLIWLLVAAVSWGEGKNDDVRVRVVGKAAIATTDEHFVCATIDWGPPQRCDATDTRCLASHPQTSVLNLDLNNPLLVKAVKAFNHLRIRVGGSLQDQVIYDAGGLQTQCLPFEREKKGLFGFTEGCLHMDRWDELNKFFNRTGAIVTFGLNALYGRRKGANGVWIGDWNLNNSRSFIEYTIEKGFQIDSWEFGNELSGRGIGARVSSKQYAKDLIKLRSLLNEIYSNSSSLPLLLAPGGFYDEQWFIQLLQQSGPGVVNVLTHHIYNLGAPDDPKLMKKVLNPAYLSHAAGTFRSLHGVIKKFGPWAAAWVGEAGGVYHGGAPDFSDRYINSFWSLSLSLSAC